MDSLIGQKLYLRIWLAVVAAVAVLALVVGWLWQVALDHEREQNASRAGREIVLRNSAGDIVGQAPARAVRVPGEGLEFQVTMKDGQTLYVQLPRANRQPGSPLPARRTQAWLQSAPGFAWLLGLVALAVALGAYPIVRRLTKRLEALQKGVERWGNGDLSTRLPVQGHDEIAFLATRFNAAAERVQTLLQSHKALLANASHELRSPLARIRMGLELMGRDSASAPQRQEIARGVARRALPGAAGRGGGQARPAQPSASGYLGRSGGIRPRSRWVACRACCCRQSTRSPTVHPPGFAPAYAGAPGW